ELQLGDGEGGGGAHAEAQRGGRGGDGERIQHRPREGSAEALVVRQRQRARERPGQLRFGPERSEKLPQQRPDEEEQHRRHRKRALHRSLPSQFTNDRPMSSTHAKVATESVEPYPKSPERISVL